MKKSYKLNMVFTLPYSFKAKHGQLPSNDYKNNIEEKEKF